MTRWTRTALKAIGVALLLIGGCQRSDPNRLQGYVEGEFVYIAAPLSGEVQSLKVRRGDQVRSGDDLFTLEGTSELAARDEAARRVDQAQAYLADLDKGQRPSEMASLWALREQAEAQLAYSQTEFARITRLYATSNASADELERVNARREQDRARVGQMSANLETAALGARQDVIAAAQADLQARQAALRKAQWSVDQCRQVAPSDGVVFDTLYRVGEQVPANRPVVMLLPPANIKVRAFVPERRAGAVHVGDSVRLTTDGLTGFMTGTIRYISPAAEYTPPVIYSRESRTKLVYMIEVSLSDDDAVRLRPGQPVEVELSP